MKRKKNGFTLIEVLAVLVILTVLLGIAIPAVSGYLKKGTKAYYSGIETDVLAAGRDYLLDYKSLYPREIGNATVVTLEELTGNKYISVPKDENGNPCDGTVTVIKKATNNYEYHVCLKCGTKFTSNEKECSYVGNNNELRNYEIALNSDLPATVKQCDPLTIPEATVTETVGDETNVVSTTIKGNPSSIDTTVLSTNTITWSYRTKKITRTVQVIDTVAPVIESIQLTKTSGSSYGGEITNKDLILQINAKDYACESGTPCREKYPKLDGSGIKAVYYKEKSATDWKIYSTNKNNITIPLNVTIWGTLQVKVVDNVGKESGIKEIQIQIDKEKPSKTIVDYLSGSSSTKWQNNIKIKLSATDNKGVAYYEIYKDGTYYGTTGEIWTPPNNFSSNNVTFRAVDIVGNKGAFSDSQKIHMDTENPSKTVVNLNGYSSGSWTNQNVKQSFTATDNVGVTFYEYAYNQGTTGSKAVNPWTITTDGEWTIWVRAQDEAGNIGEWSNVYVVKRDTVRPSCSLAVTGNPNKYGDVYTQGISIGFASISDDRSQVASSSINTPTITSTTASGGVTVVGTVTDAANNSNTCSIIVKVDVQKPTISSKSSLLSLGSADYNFQDNVTASFGFTGGSVACNPPSSLKTGTYTVRCTATGNNGQVADPVTFNVRHSYDATPTCPNGGTYVSSTKQCSYTNNETVCGCSTWKECSNRDCGTETCCTGGFHPGWCCDGDCNCYAPDGSSNCWGNCGSTDGSHGQCCDHCGDGNNYPCSICSEWGTCNKSCRTEGCGCETAASCNTEPTYVCSVAGSQLGDGSANRPSKTTCYY